MKNLTTKIKLSAWIFTLLFVWTFIWTNIDNMQSVIKKYYLENNISFAKSAYADYEYNVKQLEEKIGEAQEKVEKLNNKKAVANDCAEINRNWILLNCKEELLSIWSTETIEEQPKTEVFEMEIIEAIDDFDPNKTLIICGHWRSQNDKWNDNWALFWEVTEREMIKKFTNEIISKTYEKWFHTFWCDTNKTLNEKLKVINWWNYDKIIEIHFDKRPKWKNVTQWIKVLYAYKWEKDWNHKWRIENRDFAEDVCNWIETCTTSNTWGLMILNSSNIPTVIIEVADPDQENFENYKKQVLKYFSNF